MTETKKQNYALPIAIMFALFFMIAFVTGLPSPMGVIVAKQFGATNFESQLGFFANFIAYAFMGLPAGMMLKRRGYKFTALSAVTVGFIGVGVQFLSGQFGEFWIYLVGAFISGFSMCMLNTVVNPMLNTLGGGGNKGNQLIQWGGSINSIAATITPILVGYLMGAEAGRTIEKANPAMFLAMGIFALAFIVLAIAKIPEPGLELEKQLAAKNANQPKVKDKFGPMSFRHFVLGTIAIFVYVGVEIGIPSTANLYMTDSVNGLGIDAAMAGTVVGTYWLLMLIGRLIGASIGAKVSSRAMMIFTTIVATILLCIAIFLPSNIIVSMPAIKSDPFGFSLVQVPLSVMLIVLCGLCTSIMWGSIFNLAVEGLGKYTAKASGIFMVLVCGGGIIPLIQGWVADMSGYVASYWVMVACMIYMLFYALVGCKNVNKNIPVD